MIFPVLTEIKSRTVAGSAGFIPDVPQEREEMEQFYPCDKINSGHINTNITFRVPPGLI
jgi:hypothetical protein